MPAPTQTAARSPFALGLLVALFSAATFGSSGTFGAALLETGWTPGALVTARITGAALVMAVPAAIAMRGHWHLVRRNIPRLLAYGVFAVAGCQFAYFMAVDHLSANVPDVRVTTWDDVAHLPSMERPGDFTDLVLDWVAGAEH